MRFWRVKCRGANHRDEKGPRKRERKHGNGPEERCFERPLWLCPAPQTRKSRTRRRLLMSRWQSEQSARQRKRGQKRTTGTRPSQIKTLSLYPDVVRRRTTYVEPAHTTEANANASRERIEGAAFVAASWPIPPSAETARSSPYWPLMPCSGCSSKSCDASRNTDRPCVGRGRGRRERYRAKTLNASFRASTAASSGGEMGSSFVLGRKLARI